jgi:hypothetical protein
LTSPFSNNFATDSACYKKRERKAAALRNAAPRNAAPRNAAHCIRNKPTVAGATIAFIEFAMLRIA